MRNKIQELVEISQDIECRSENNKLFCNKGNLEIIRKIDIPRVQLKIESKMILLIAEKGNKKEFKAVKSQAAHIKNIFRGLQKPFIYKLEACYVHFPMTLKVEDGKLLINNFLGEKVRRTAEILPEVDVEIKGQKITVFSHNLEAAGQTAANIERATKVKNRDRRTFQDGIFIVEKPEVEK